MENPAAKISFVVLVYNRKDVIEQNLDRLLEISWPNKEIVVVDNCSIDGSRELIKGKYASLPGVKYIESAVNGGVCPGRNQGFRNASGDYVIYLDDDAVAPLDICKKTVEIFESNPAVGCLAFHVRNMPEGAFANNCPANAMLANYHGAGHAFKKEALGKAGLLDEMFFFGGEELDHTIAMRQAGFETRFTPEVVIDHFVKKRDSRIFANRAANWMASMNFVYIKRFPWRYALPLMFRQWLSMSFASLKRSAVSPMFKGPWITLKGLAAALGKRCVISDEILAVYLDPRTQPNHCRIPFAKFWAGYHARKAQKKGRTNP